MSEKIKLEIIPRRSALYLLGLPIVLGIAASSTPLTLKDAQAQTTGMERRQDRRTGRQQIGRNGALASRAFGSR
jgi:hypothetical protein